MMDKCNIKCIINVNKITLIEGVKQNMCEIWTNDANDVHRDNNDNDKHICSGSLHPKWGTRVAGSRTDNFYFA